MTVDAPPRPTRHALAAVFTEPQRCEPDYSTTPTDQIPVIGCGQPFPPDVDPQDAGPCTHSLIRQLCCRCAGCMEGKWWCGRLPATSTWLSWALQLILGWLGGPGVLFGFAGLVLVTVTSHALAFGIWVCLLMGALLLAAVIVAVAHIL